MIEYWINNTFNTISSMKDQDNKYLGFYINENGSGSGIANGMLDYLDERKINYDNLELVGCDGTAANTGHKVILLQFCSYRDRDRVTVTERQARL